MYKIRERKLKVYNDKFKILIRNNTEDYKICRQILIEDQLLGLLPSLSLNPEDSIIDLGAHIGVFSILASSKLSIGGKVYAIEPCSKLYECLNDNTALNRANNVYTYNIAISKENDQKVKLYIVDCDEWKNSIIKNCAPEGEKYELVKTKTLEQFILNNKINKCALMKMNCEGAEFEIILNTPEKILRQINQMIICYHHDLTKDHTKDDIKNRLLNIGYSVKIKEKNNDRGFIIAVKK